MFFYPEERFLKYIVLAFFLTSSLSAQSLSIKDSTNTDVKLSKHVKIFFSLKGGIKLAESINYPGTKSGTALSAGVGIELGNDFYFKPVMSYWNSKTVGRTGETLKYLAYMAEIEYLMVSEGFTIAAGAGMGGISTNNRFSGRPGLLLELGLLYPVGNKFSVYAGASYYYLLPLDLSNSVKSISSFIINMGLYYNI